jgi:uncharacterized membrane protein (UPF0127 family)
MRWFALILFLAAGFFSGCRKNAETPPDSAALAQPAEPRLPTKAQPQLQTIRLWLGAEELKTELALTPEEQETGLMFRTNLPENAGMLFVSSRPIRAEFWMKNTLIPLSVGYIDPDGNLLEIHDMQPQNTNSVVANSQDVQYVLEVNQGWFERHHIPVGTLVRTELGSLHDTFFNRRR